MSYEDVLALASDLEYGFETWYDQSILPHSPDRNALKELYFEIVKEYNKWN